MKGSPVKSGRHVHVGIWLCTWHWAFIPQEPGHGSRHFSEMQAVIGEQSVLTTHSGLQLGGIPT